MLKKSIAIAALAGVLALGITGCGSAPASSASASGSSGASAAPSAESAAPAAEKDFDGSAFSDTGAGIMFLRTAGGTTEGGNVPEIAAKPSTIMQIELDTSGMDGSVCTVYVDGIENDKMNAGERVQKTLTIQGSAVEAGVHTVELVKMDGDKPAIYKKAQYKIV